MWVGMIVAGDNEIEAAAMFDSRQEAEDKMEQLLREEYVVGFDRVEITVIQTLDEIRAEIAEAKREEAEYQANENPTGFVVETKFGKE